MPLSDTENLMVGAFGGTLECAVQSEFPGLCPDLRPTVLATQTTPSDRTRPTPSRRSAPHHAEDLPAEQEALPDDHWRCAPRPLSRLAPSFHRRAVRRSSTPSSYLPFVLFTPLITLAGWFRGVTAAAAPLGPITAVQVAVNGAIERVVTGGDRDPTDPERVGVAMAAGAVSSVLYSPVDLVVIQQQKLGLDSPGATISAIVKEHGASGMMRGFWSCVVREAIYTAGYLGLAPIAKDYLTGNVEYFKSNDLAASIVGSSIGGTVAAVLTHPVDTSKTCAQSDIAGVKYPNARTALGMVYKDGGIGALYGGGLARTARLCGAFFIINNIREAAIDWKTARAEA